VARGRKHRHLKGEGESLAAQTVLKGITSGRGNRQKKQGRGDRSEQERRRIH